MTGARGIKSLKYYTALPSWKTTYTTPTRSYSLDSGVAHHRSTTPTTSHSNTTTTTTTTTSSASATSSTTTRIVTTTNYVNQSAQEAFINTLIWNHCKHIVQVRPMDDESVNHVTSTRHIKKQQQQRQQQNCSIVGRERLWMASRTRSKQLEAMEEESLQNSEITTLSSSYSPQLTHRFKMLFQTIDSVVHLARETRDTFTVDKNWYKYYQSLFCEITQSNSEWKREMQRLYKLNPKSMQQLRQQFRQVLNVLQELTYIPTCVSHDQSTAVTTTNDSHGNTQLVQLDASIVTAFVDIILDSEVFHDNKQISGKCSILIEQIKALRKKKQQKQQQSIKHQQQYTPDYYLIERLARALIREREVLEVIDMLPLDEPMDELDESMREYCKQQVSDIRKLIDSYITEEPHIPLYYTLRKMLIARIPWEKDQASEIKRDCDQLIDQLGQTRDLDAYIERAIALAELKRFEEAEQDCNRALAINPILPDIYFTLVAIDMIRGDYINGLLYINEAIYAVQHILHGKPDSTNLLEELKTECLSICRESIADRTLYEILLSLIECRILLFSHQISASSTSEPMSQLFESLMNLCHTRIISLYPNNLELLAAVYMLNVTYEVQVLRRVNDVFHKLTQIASLLPNHPGVRHFIGLTYFSAFGCVVDREDLTFDSSLFLELSLEAFNKALDISHGEPMLNYRYTPYRTMCSLAAVTAYLGQESDQYRIRLCTDALEQLKDTPDSIMIPKLLMYRASFAEQAGLVSEALKDLDRLLSLDPLNISALTKRRDLLNKLGLRPETASEDDQLVTTLMEEAESFS